MSDATPDEAARATPWITWPAAVGAVLLVGAFLAHLRPWRFLCDDAYISFRYAKNLVDHGGLIFNTAPPEYVEGYTNLLWVLVLAGGYAVGLLPETLAPLLTAASSLVALGLAVWLLQTLRHQLAAERSELRPPVGLADLLPAALLVASPEFVVWGSGGLETSFALALVLGSMVAWTEGRLVWAAVLAAAAGLTRLDALLPIAGFGLAWLAVLGGRRWRAGELELASLPWARLGVAALVFAGPLLLQLVVRKAYYGDWLPNTWAVKHHGALLRDTYGVAYLQAWATHLHLLLLAPLAIMLRPRHLLVVVPGGLVLWWSWSVGGDFMAYSRFLIVATTGLGILVAWLLLDAEEAVRPVLEARLGWGLPLFSVAGLALALGLASQIPGRVEEDRDKPWIDGKWEGVMGMDRFARVRVAAGRWLGEHLPPETVVTVGAAGAMPYGSGLQIVDVYGLVDPRVVELAEPASGDKARPGHQLYAPRKYLRERDPDLLCHAGYAGVDPPRRAWARRRWHAPVRWASVDVGEIVDPRSPAGVMDGGYYCCLQPKDRPRGPFEPPRKKKKRTAP